MSPEPKTGPVRVHPFFDPESTYRLLTQGHFWADGGKQSVRAFFKRLRLRDLDERLLSVSPESLDWEDNANANANRVVQDYLGAVREDVNKRRGQRERAPDYAPTTPGGPRPWLLTFDLTQDPPELLAARDGPGNLFTGIGRKEQPEIDQFRVEITDLPPGRRCLLLLLESETVNRLRRALVPAADATAVPQDPEGVIGRALADAALGSRPDADPATRGRAGRLQEVWACAEGLEVTTDRDGWIVEQVALERPARLDPSTWVVLCQGPEVA